MNVRRVNGIAIVAPKGWMMGGDETEQLEKTVLDLLAAGNRCLVLDLIGVHNMNSTALGKFTMFHRLYQDKGGRAALCNTDKRIENILVITKLSLVFDVYPSEREAVASFEGLESPDWK